MRDEHELNFKRLESVRNSSPANTNYNIKINVFMNDKSDKANRAREAMKRPPYYINKK